MATEDTPISAEAQARHTIDGLKAELAQAKAAISQTLVRDKLVETFARQGVANPFAIATRALSDFKDVAPDTPDTDLAQKASSWYAEQRAIFGGEPAPAPSTSPPPSPFSSGVQPNLTAPGLAPKVTPVVIGTKDYAEQWANKPMSEQIEAMKQGQLVSSDKVKLQQQDGGFLR